MRILTLGGYAGILSFAVWVAWDFYVFEKDFAADLRDARVYALAKGSGLLAAALILMQFIVPARIKFLDRVWGFDRLFTFHKIAGVTGTVLALLHPYLVFATSRYSSSSDFSLSDWPRHLGGLAVVILLLVAFTSLARKTLKLSYENWYRIHLLAHVAIAGVLIHVFILGDDLSGGGRRASLIGFAAAVVGLFVLKRIALPFVLARRRFAVVVVAQSSYNVTTIELAPVGWGGFRHLPGQFAFLKLRGDGVRAQEHPFTIASAPALDGRLSFSIKSVGDFTAAVRALKVGDTATVDGPYGRFSYRLRPPRDLVLIAGGIGITPMLGMLRTLAAEQSAVKIVLVWGNATDRDIAFGDELAGLSEKLNLTVHHVISRTNTRGPIARVDRALLEKLLTPVADPLVFVCGPPAMMRDVSRDLKKIGVRSRDIVCEKFSY